MVFTGYHVSTNFREGATIKCVLRQVCTATFNSFTSLPRKQLGKPCSEGPYIFPLSTKLKRKLPGHVCGSWDTKVAFKHLSFHRPGQWSFCPNSHLPSLCAPCSTLRPCTNGSLAVRHPPAHIIQVLMCRFHHESYLDSDQKWRIQYKA